MLEKARKKYEKLDIKDFNKWLKTQTFYRDGLTLSEIGYIMGVTRENIRQLEKRALKKLKSPKIGNSLKKYMLVTNSKVETYY